jgi:SAM-dependent methyltransferase
MNDQGKSTAPGDAGAVRLFKKDFWSQENLKFSQPWYRLEKTVRLLNELAGGRECTLLDVGCGPAALMRFLPPNIHYYGIDIAIQEPAPNLLELDIVESPVRFGDKKFDIVIAQGVFEYLGEAQSKKFSEIALLLNEGGRFVTTYTNFSHRKKYIYPAFSNVQPFDSFRQDLARYFKIDKVFPVSHNWKHGHPSRKLVKAVNMHVNANIPFISPMLAVEYYFVCSPRGQ